MANGIIIPEDLDIYSDDVETFIGYCGNKKLYRIFHEFGAVSANTDTVVLNHSTTFDGIDVISLTGVGYQSDGSDVTLGHYYDASNNSALWFNNKRIFVRTSKAYTKGYITMIYAK